MNRLQGLLSVIILTALLFSGSIFYFSRGVSEPKNLLWDEAYHVTAARSFLYSPPEYQRHPNNPPLGRELIALSIFLLGDHPLAHRLPSIVAASGISALIFFGIYFWTKNPLASFLGALLWLSSPLAYVHARIGMLDMMLTFFFFASLLAFLVLLRANNGNAKYIWLGIALFLATLATLIKLLGVILFPLFLLALVLNRNPWVRRKILPTFFVGSAIFLIVGFVISYKILGFSWGEIPERVWLIYRTQSQRHADYRGLSQWYEWFLLQGDAWYFTTPIQSNQAVLSTNNPLLWIGGAICSLFLLIHSIIKKNLTLFTLIMGLIFQIIFWVLFKDQTILYYGLPLIPIFCLSLVLLGWEFMGKNKQAPIFLTFYTGLLLALSTLLFFPLWPQIQYGPK